jgi:hypothetical protein
MVLVSAKKVKKKFHACVPLNSVILLTASVPNIFFALDGPKQDYHAWVS